MTSTIQAVVAVFLIPGVCFVQGNAALPTTVVADNSIQLPSPSGPFAIGTKTYDWVDLSRHEKASKNPGFRQIIVQVWYPTKSAGNPTSPYVPRLSAYRQVCTRSAFELASHTQTHSQVNAKPIPELRLPVVLLSHGWQGTRSEYTTLAEDLASHGYAVFGVDHPYMGWVALPNGKVTEATEEQFRGPAETTEYYGRDLQFVIEQITKLNASDRAEILAGRLDLSQIAAIGHSSGFSAVSTACRRDLRIKACINIDAPGFKTALLAGLHQPLLWIRLERAGAVPGDFLRMTTATVYELEIKGANHGSPEDWDYLEAQTSQDRKAAAQRLTLIRDYVKAFLGKTLRGQDSVLLIDSQTNAVKLTHYQPR